jgi:hypothetical protein
MVTGISIITYQDGLDLKYKLDRVLSITQLGQEKVKFVNLTVIIMILLVKLSLLMPNIIKFLMLLQQPAVTRQLRHTTFSLTGLPGPTVFQTWKALRLTFSSTTF